MGFPSNANSYNWIASFNEEIFSNISMRLFERKILCNRGQCYSPCTDSIRFLLRFNSVKDIKPFKLSTIVIRLLARFKTLNSER